MRRPTWTEQAHLDWGVVLDLAAPPIRDCERLARPGIPYLHHARLVAARKIIPVVPPPNNSDHFLTLLSTVPDGGKMVMEAAVQKVLEDVLDNVSKTKAKGKGRHPDVRGLDQD